MEEIIKCDTCGSKNLKLFLVLNVENLPNGCYYGCEDCQSATPEKIKINPNQNKLWTKEKWKKKYI